MRQTADLILAHDQNLEPKLLAHAVAVFMAGAILERDAGAALQTFRRHRQRLSDAREWEPVFRFLLAQADRAPHSR
jgi:hypothetical protein